MARSGEALLNSDQLDLWPAEVAALPWGGQSPRAMAQVVVQGKLLVLRRFMSCNVDKSVVRCPSREAHYVPRKDVDAAQWMLCVSTSFSPGG